MNIYLCKVILNKNSNPQTAIMLETENDVAFVFEQMFYITFVKPLPDDVKVEDKQFLNTVKELC